VLVFTTLLYYL